MKVSLWKKIAPDQHQIQEIVEARMEGRYTVICEGSWKGFRFRPDGKPVTMIPDAPVLRDWKPEDEQLLIDAHARVRCQQRFNEARQNIAWGRTDLDILTGLAELTETAVLNDRHLDWHRPRWIAAVKRLVEQLEKDP